MTAPALPSSTTTCTSTPQAAARCSPRIRWRGGHAYRSCVAFPPWSLGIDINSPEDYRKVFDKILRSRNARRRLKKWRFLLCWVFILPTDKILRSPRTCALHWEMRGGLENCARICGWRKSRGIEIRTPAITKLNRKYGMHQTISCAIVRACKGCWMCCADSLQKAQPKKGFQKLAGIARSVGLPPEKVVKHFSPPMVKNMWETRDFPERAGRWKCDRERTLRRYAFYDGKLIT